MEHTSEFNTKLEKACHKKEALFEESKMRYYDSLLLSPHSYVCKVLLE